MTWQWHDNNITHGYSLLLIVAHCHDIVTHCHMSHVIRTIQWVDNEVYMSFISCKKISGSLLKYCRDLIVSMGSPWHCRIFFVTQWVTMSNNDMTMSNNEWQWATMSNNDMLLLSPPPEKTQPDSSIEWIIISKLSSDDKWQWVTMTWQWQWVTMSDNEWQWVTMSDNM